MVVAIFATTTLAVSLLLTLCRLLTPESRPWVLATAFVPYAVPGYASVALVLVVAVRHAAPPRRAWFAAAAAVAATGLVFHAGLLLPLYVGAHAGGEPDLTVMTVNLRLGQADAPSVVRLAGEQHVDVLVLEEVTPAAAGALRVAGVLEALPHVAGAPGPGPDGTVVVSRYPLVSESVLGTGQGGYCVRVDGPRPFWLVAVHPSQPLRQGSAWNRDWATIDRAVDSLHGPRLLVGDLNATLDHGPVRTVLGHGLRDAATEADSGWQPTWPSGVAAYRLPLGWGLFAIDHVLLSEEFGALSTGTFDVAGTDHKALVARLVASPR